MLITEAVDTPTFANHESFHLRYAWLKKAYDRTLEDGRVFAGEDATVRLGVGKNMVRSIRHWGLAHKVLEPAGKKNNPALRPAPMGDVIFGERGLDPYMEDPNTLWLLHWLLYAPPCRIPVWWIIMNEFPATNVKLEDLGESVTTRVTNIPDWKTPSPNSVKKDIDVFVHTYTTSRDKSTIEDYLDCPFRQMHMIRQSSRDVIRFVHGRKYGLSPLMAAYACLDFIARSGIRARTVPVSRLATEAGGVGNIFKLAEGDLVELLREAAGSSDLKLENVNGAYHLRFDSARDQSEELLAKSYGKRRITAIKRPKMEALAH